MALLPTPNTENSAATERLLFQAKRKGPQLTRLGRLLASGILSSGLLIVYMTRIATRWLRITRLRLGMPALPAEWRGLKIAVLTDFHAGGQRVSPAMLARAKQTALDYDPDLVVLGGDFYDNGRRVETGDLFTAWPAGLPVVAVTGNHDFRGAPENLSRLLEELRAGAVMILRNQAVPLNLRGRRAWVAGVEDPHTRRDDVTGALAQLPDDEQALLFVSHSPSSAVDLPPGAARLVVAGHTHGGQMRLLPSGRIPFIKQIRRLKGLRSLPPMPYVRGQHWHAGALIVISDGLGQSTVGARLRTRPELILLELDEAPLEGPACDEAERYVTYQGDESRLLRWLT
jgi:predicted MPP superfamily phosphohydrolase